ncbi:MAG TPA: S8 family serine peptidase [Thermoanaerobaculia bacterium]|nr:S8 family serine peptidase [Thermoanaerobaculia bacterium]
MGSAVGLLLVVGLLGGTSRAEVSAPGTSEVRAGSYRFDPLRQGEPALPAALRAQNAGGLRLVQLVGPTRPEWLATLAERGLRVLQYLPFHTYLVWAGAGDHSLEGLDFVRWQGAYHPAYKLASDLAGRAGRIRNLDLFVYPAAGLTAFLESLQPRVVRVVDVFPAQADQLFFDVLVEADAAALAELARVPEVVWIGYASPEGELEDEVANQIVAGNHVAGQPLLGYGAHLKDLGVTGAGVIFAIPDSGVDYDHPDVASRIVGGVSFPGCESVRPGDAFANGHGTHLAGILAGTAAAGLADEDGFLWGQGVAPGAGIFTLNPLCPGFLAWPPPGGWPALTAPAVRAGAIGSSNSWQTGEGPQHGYQASERLHDVLARDGDFDTPEAEPFVMVFAAGNFGLQGLSAPKEAKNLIVAANSYSSRAGSIEEIYPTSSRGPALDGRWVPTVAAPGVMIASARADTASQNCGATAIPGTGGLYAFCQGTSMAAPHVAGAIALFVERYRAEHDGEDPSPALVRAMVVATAVDLGEPDVPNGAEGWGRVQATELVAPSRPVLVWDEIEDLTESDEELELTVAVADRTRPLVVTLAWTDAPGAPGADPALVNDLDLRVESAGQSFWGNHFQAGASAPGGEADRRNNLENVRILAPGSFATIRVSAFQIAGDGVPSSGASLDQDFALVCWNCLEAEPLFADGFETGDLSGWPVVASAAPTFW